MKNILALTMAVFISGASAAFAQEGAVLRGINGNVQVRQSGYNGWSVAEENMRVQVKDRVKTADNSSCDLVFDDGTTLEIGENSETDLGSNSSSAQTYARSVFLWLGRLLAHVEKTRGGAGRFDVHTPVAVCSVRGTEFAVETAENSSSVGVFDGEVSVKNTIGTAGPETRVSKGFETAVKKGQRPFSPRVLSANMLRNRDRMQAVRKRVSLYRQQPPKSPAGKQRSILQKTQTRNNQIKPKQPQKQQPKKLKSENNQ